MKYLAIVAVVLAVGNAQSILDQLNSQDNVILTRFNPNTNTDFLQFTSADPTQQTTNSDGDLDTTLLVYTTRREVIEYWGLAASYEAKRIWASNSKRATLTEFNLEDGDVTTVARDLTHGLENMAYDRITRILYWTDSIDKAIRAMELSYRHFTQIYQSTDVSPYALAIHPVKRQLFYSSYLRNNGFISKTEIVRCNLDGSGKRTILKFPNVIRPRGMTIDLSDDKLFWTDTNFGQDGVVMASDLDGRLSRQFFAKTNSYLWGIAHYKSYIYVTDIVNTTADEYDIHIRNSNGRGGVVKTSPGLPRNVAIYGPDATAKTKVSNECDNSRCEHICLASGGKGFVCKCSPGFKLVSGYKCESKSLTDDYLVMSDVGQKRVFQLPIKSSASSVGDLVAVDLEDKTDRRINAVAVDKSSGELVWYDLAKQEMVWGDKRISQTETVLNVAVDCCGKKIYWTTLRDIYSWDGQSARPEEIYSLSFFSDSQIRQLAVDCRDDFVYWVEYESLFQQSTVKRSDLKGRDVEVVMRNIRNTFAISIDYESEALYVMTAFEGEAYKIALATLKRLSGPVTSSQYETINLKKGITDTTIFITSFTVVNGYMYLNDDANDVVRRFSLSGGPATMENYGDNKIFYPTALDFYSTSYNQRYLRPICNPGFTPPSTTSPAITTTTTAGKPSSPTVDCMAIFRQLSQTDFNTAFAQLMACLFAQP